MDNSTIPWGDVKFYCEVITICSGGKWIRVCGFRDELVIKHKNIPEVEKKWIKKYRDDPKVKAVLISIKQRCANQLIEETL